MVNFILDYFNLLALCGMQQGCHYHLTVCQWPPDLGSSLPTFEIYWAGLNTSIHNKFYNKYRNHSFF